MATKITLIGKYRVYYWNRMMPAGHSGWVVVVPGPSGGLGEVLSKHATRAQALAQAKLYKAGDERRAAAADTALALRAKRNRVA